MKRLSPVELRLFPSYFTNNRFMQELCSSIITHTSEIFFSPDAICLPRKIRSQGVLPPYDAIFFFFAPQPNTIGLIMQGFVDAEADFKSPLPFWLSYFTKPYGKRTVRSDPYFVAHLFGPGASIHASSPRCFFRF